MGGIKQLIVLYDIMCQYHVNLKKRIKKSAVLSIPSSLQICPGIGLFHVHGHKEECLYRFGPTYISGAGQVDGEILETLWATLNEISRSTQTATLANRIEVLDDHMGDNNWKKMIRSGTFASRCGLTVLNCHFSGVSILRKYDRALAGFEKVKEELAQVESMVQESDLMKWRKGAASALKQRITDPKKMDYFAPKKTRGMLPNFITTSNKLVYRSNSCGCQTDRGRDGVGE